MGLTEAEKAKLVATFCYVSFKNKRQYFNMSPTHLLIMFCVLLQLSTVVVATVPPKGTARGPSQLEPTLIRGHETDSPTACHEPTTVCFYWVLQ